MTSRELLYVKTVADCGSISRAAKLLYIAQPSLSQSLQRIEDTLGTKLFQRGQSGLRLTYAGEQYYQMASQILKIYDDFESSVMDINDLKSGHVCFGITNYLGAMLLPELLSAFTSRCPNISLDVFEGTTDMQEERLLSGDLDFSIMHAPADSGESNPSIHYEILREDPFVIVLKQDHPLCSKAVPAEGYPYPVLDVRLLKGQPFLSVPRSQRMRHITDSVMKKANITPDIRFVSKNYMTLEKLAGKGIGIAMLPKDYITDRNYPDPPALLSIDRKYNAVWELCIAKLKGAFISRADGLLLSILREQTDSTA